MIHLEQVELRQRGFRMRIGSLKLPAGLTLLVGRNGAGKSTLLKLLATAMEPDRGTIRYGSATAKDALPLIRSQIGYVPTGIELYEEMTVRQLLRYLGELKGLHDAGELDRLCALLQIEDDRAKIKHLSQGNRQKIAVAQAMLGSPYLLLLDEPLNALDSRERKLITRLLIQYARNHIVVVATHEINEWNDQMDRLLWMHEGEVRFFGTREAWMEVAGIQVWEGTVDDETWMRVPLHQRLRAKEFPRGKEVRIAAATPPGEGFRATVPSAEEIYLIRQWHPNRDPGPAG